LVGGTRWGRAEFFRIVFEVETHRQRKLQDRERSGWHPSCNSFAMVEDPTALDAYDDFLLGDTVRPEREDYDDDAHTDDEPSEEEEEDDDREEGSAERSKVGGEGGDDDATDADADAAGGLDSPRAMVPVLGEGGEPMYDDLGEPLMQPAPALEGAAEGAGDGGDGGDGGAGPQDGDGGSGSGGQGVGGVGPQPGNGGGGTGEEEKDDGVSAMSSVGGKGKGGGGGAPGEVVTDGDADDVSSVGSISASVQDGGFAYSGAGRFEDRGGGGGLQVVRRVRPRQFDPGVTSPVFFGFATKTVAEVYAEEEAKEAKREKKEREVVRRILQQRREEIEALREEQNHRAARRQKKVDKMKRDHERGAAGRAKELESAKKMMAANEFKAFAAVFASDEASVQRANAAEVAELSEHNRKITVSEGLAMTKLVAAAVAAEKAQSTDR